MKGKALLLAPLLLASPLAAQEFEGVIGIRFGGAPAGQPEMMQGTMTVKGSSTVMAMKMPASAGPMAGQEARVVFDNAAKSATMLMPMPPGMPAMGDAKGVKMVMKMEDVDAKMGEIESGELKKLGTSQTVAELKCDDYELVMKNEKPLRMCLSKGLGRFTMLDPTIRGRAGSSAPKWARTLQKDGYFPLKVWNTDDQVAFEVTSVQRKPVPDTAFTIPSGYMDMSGMAGGMGRRQ